MFYLEMQGLVCGNPSPASIARCAAKARNSTHLMDQPFYEGVCKVRAVGGARDMKRSLWHQATDPEHPLFLSCPGTLRGVTARRETRSQQASLACGSWVRSLPKAQDTVMLSDVI